MSSFRTRDYVFLSHFPFFLFHLSADRWDWGSFYTEPFDIKWAHTEYEQCFISSMPNLYTYIYKQNMNLSLHMTSWRGGGKGSAQKASNIHDYDLPLDFSIQPWKYPSPVSYGEIFVNEYHWWSWKLIIKKYIW